MKRLRFSIISFILIFCLAIVCAVTPQDSLAAAASTSSASAAVKQQTERYAPYQVTKKITYYAAPKASAKAVGTLAKGKTVAVIKNSKQEVGQTTWYKIRLGSKRYYVKQVGIRKLSIARPSKNGALQVKGSKLVDQDGKSVQLRGLSTHGIAWYPQYINKDCFRHLSKDWNVNCIRLAMYTQEYGGYCTGGDQKDLEDLIVKGVKLAKQQDLYAIVDWHSLSDGDPNTHLQDAKRFFKRISARLKDYDNVLYEICNEPNGGTSWKQIRSYANQVIPVIRKNDADSVIIVGTPTWSQGVETAAKSPLKQENLLYALHFYAATHKSDLRSSMLRAGKAGLPIFVSEFGISEASGSGSIDTAEANRWIAALNQRGISYVAWNLSNKDETCALLKSSCTKTSGFANKDLSAAGKWLYRLLTGLSAPSTASAGGQDSASSQTDSAASTPQQPGQTDADHTNPAGLAGDKTNQSSEKGATYAAAAVNQWTSNGTTYTQYALTITNPTSQTISWAVTLTFDGPVSIQSIWNGTFTVSGNTIRVSGVDYNGTLAPGASVSDVGLIVSGGNAMISDN